MNTGKYHFIESVIIALLIVGLFLLFDAYQDAQETIRDAFIAHRVSIAEMDLQGKRRAVEEEFGYLFHDCEDRQQYDRYINTDSRSMSATELQEALGLHAECGGYFAGKNNLTLSFFEADVKGLSTIAGVLTNGRTKNNASRIAELWENIYRLEKEHNDIYNRMVSIQEEYWDAELRRVLGLDAAEVREAEVSTLNHEANQKLARIEAILEEVRGLRAREGMLWKESFGSVWKENAED